MLGSSEATLRNEDGSLSAADNATLAFGGVSGDALSIVNGLFVTKTAVAEVAGTFAETHTDAWGRTHKIITPSKSSGSTQTTFDFSLPSETLKRVITTDPAGRKMITESDTEEMISRSGIDVNGNGSLGASDRYTESTTEVVSGKVVTTLTVTEDSGMREVLETSFTPSTGVTVTKINGNEETITTTPNYDEKTATTASSKGWSRTTGVNSLGLTTTNTLTGTGIPTTSLNPVWRADGSLANVSLTIGGETHTASFNEDNTLASLTAPGRGNILGEHSISNGVELLTVNGKTIQRKLDGTEKSTSGGNVIGKSEVLSKSGTGYKETITPAVGAATETAYNAAFATTGKTYADSTGETLAYIGELLSSITLARGGALTLAYSNDGAKDLTAATWPAITSGPFTIPAIGHGYEYNRSGQIKTQTDSSGTRSLSYLKGRMSGSLYTAGLLKGYQIIPGRDEFGRQTGTLLKRDGNTIHTTVKALNGASDQITNLASENITATPQRNAAGNITGYVWSDGTNTVTQTWTRGAGGRIEKAESDVAGAPAFDYLLDPNDPEESFDAFGRRLKCETAGGAWSYTYGAGGQLSSATHPTLGTFNYAFDGIGRRTDKGNANTTDILNRTTAWTHNQNKTLSIKAHPDARVWFNGVEIQNFTGNYQAAITPPGANGGWVPWETLAIYENAGEGAGNPALNPLADPDAKSEKRGAVWVPPTAETFTFDAAGNRLSSAQFDYGWDAKNQLARVRTKNHTTAAQAYDLTFTYDSEGRRIKKHVIEYQNGAVVSEKIITFIWDGWDLFYERHQLPSGLTTLERKYLWGPDIADGAAGGAGGLLLITETKGSATTNIIPLCDGTGHVCALTDINKNLLATYAYGPFGEKITATGSQANNNPWRWGTKYLDQETGLYYFGKRYYDPITGQFLSREPLGESESINLYSYAGNDPINGIDVMGLKTKRFTNLGIEELEKIWGKGFFDSWVKKQGYAPLAKADWMETQTDFFDQYVAGLGYNPQEGSYSEALNAPIVNPIHRGTHSYFMWQGNGGENLYIVPHNFWGKAQTPFGWSVSDTWEEAAAEIKQQAFYGSGVLEMSRNVIQMGTGAAQGNLIGALGRLRTPVNPPAVVRPPGSGQPAANNANGHLILENVIASRNARASSGFAQASRKWTATDFYQASGWSSKRIQNHLGGIDFTKPVTVATLPSGSRYVQYQLPGAPIGNYFSPLGTSGSQLGIYTGGRTASIYETTGNVRVLQSTAASIVDDWSVPFWRVQTDGGGQQFFAPNPNPFQLVDP